MVCGGVQLVLMCGALWNISFAFTLGMGDVVELWFLVGLFDFCPLNAGRWYSSRPTLLSENIGLALAKAMLTRPSVRLSVRRQ